MWRGIDDELLDEHAVVAERGLGLRLREGEAFLHFLAVEGDAHALAAAAGRGLDHHGIADLVGDLDGVLRVGDLAEVAGHGRDLGRGCGLLGFDLVAHGGDGLRVGADEDDAGLGERDRECLALRQEAVARMDGLGAGLLAGVDDLVDDQIGLRRRRRADVDRFVGHLDVQAHPGRRRSRRRRS